MIRLPRPGHATSIGPRLIVHVTGPPCPPKEKEPATGAHCSSLKRVPNDAQMMLPPVNVRWRVWRSHNTCLEYLLARIPVLAFPRAIREREAVCDCV